ncbi:hypothetical protein LINPERHAP1_LOCUS22767, partial [Linum perenne]
MNHRDSSCHTLPCPINSALLLQLNTCFERRFYENLEKGFLTIVFCIGFSKRKLHCRVVWFAPCC